MNRALSVRLGADARCELGERDHGCSAVLWRANWRELPLCTRHLGADAALLKGEGRSVPEIFGAFDFWDNEPEPYEPPLTPGLYLGDTLSEAASRFMDRLAEAAGARPGPTS